MFLFDWLFFFSQFDTVKLINQGSFTLTETESEWIHANYDLCGFYWANNEKEYFRLRFGPVWSTSFSNATIS